jgi:hypothetical protein
VGTLVDPAGRSGNYDIQYTAGALTISPAETATRPEDAQAEFGYADRSFLFEAEVTSGVAVGAGDVTFRVVDATGVIVVGSPLVPVLDGLATASLTLPGGMPSGTYTIEAAFSGTSDLLASAGEAVLEVGTSASEMHLSDVPTEPFYSDMAPRITAWTDRCYESCTFVWSVDGEPVATGHDDGAAFFTARDAETLAFTPGTHLIRVISTDEASNVLERSATVVVLQRSVPRPDPTPTPVPEPAPLPEPTPVPAPLPDPVPSPRPSATMPATDTAPVLQRSGSGGAVGSASLLLLGGSLTLFILGYLRRRRTDEPAQRSRVR